MRVGNIAVMKSWRFQCCKETKYRPLTVVIRSRARNLSSCVAAALSNASCFFSSVSTASSVSCTSRHYDDENVKMKCQREMRFSSTGLLVRVKNDTTILETVPSTNADQLSENSPSDTAVSSTRAIKSTLTILPLTIECASTLQYLVKYLTAIRPTVTDSLVLCTTL